MDWESDVIEDFRSHAETKESSGERSVPAGRISVSCASDCRAAVLFRVSQHAFSGAGSNDQPVWLE